METLKILSTHKANLWLRNAKGDMPLHEAVQSGRKGRTEFYFVIELNRIIPNFINKDFFLKIVMSVKRKFSLSSSISNLDLQCRQKILLQYNATTQQNKSNCQILRLHRLNHNSQKLSEKLSKQLMTQVKWPRIFSQMNPVVQEKIFLYTTMLHYIR